MMALSDPFLPINSPPVSLLGTLEDANFLYNYPTPSPEKERQKSQLQNARSLFQRALPCSNGHVYKPTDPDLVRSWLAPYGIVLEGCDCCKFQMKWNYSGCLRQKETDLQEDGEIQKLPLSPRTAAKRRKMKRTGSEEQCQEASPETIQMQIARGAKTQANPQEIDEFVTRIMKQAEITADMEGPPAKKPRGRPRGTKSKPKVKVVKAPEVQIVKTVPAPKRNPLDRKGCVPYGLIAGLAIFNAKRAIPSKEIYRFAKHYFPGCVVGTYWKNSIRHILCTQDYFVKDRPDLGAAYSYHWDIIPAKMHRFWASVEEFRKTYPNEETYGMADSTDWPRLIKGELGLLDIDIEVDLRDYPKNIKIKPEPIDLDYGDTVQNEPNTPPVVEETPRKETMKTIRIKQEPMEEPCPAISEILNKPSISSQPPPPSPLPSASNDPQSISLRNNGTWNNPSPSYTYPPQVPVSTPSQSYPPNNCLPPHPDSRPPTPRFPSYHHQSYSSPPLGPPHFHPQPFPGQQYYRSPPLGQQNSPPFVHPLPHGMWPHPPYHMSGFPPRQTPYSYHSQPQRFGPPTNSTPNMPSSHHWYPGQMARLSPNEIEEESHSILLDLLTSDLNKENTTPSGEELNRTPWNAPLEGTAGAATPSGSTAPAISTPPGSSSDSCEDIPVEITCHLEDQRSQEKIDDELEETIPWHLYDHDYCRREPLPYPPSRLLERRP